MEIVNIVKIINIVIGSIIVLFSIIYALSKEANRESNNSSLNCKEFFNNVDALCDDYFEQNCESWFTVAHVAKGSS